MKRSYVLITALAVIALSGNATAQTYTFNKYDGYVNGATVYPWFTAATVNVDNLPIVVGGSFAVNSTTDDVYEFISSAGGVMPAVPFAGGSSTSTNILRFTPLIPLSSFSYSPEFFPAQGKKQFLARTGVSGLVEEVVFGVPNVSTNLSVDAGTLGSSYWIGVCDPTNAVVLGAGGVGALFISGGTTAAEPLPLTLMALGTLVLLLRRR